MLTSKYIAHFANEVCEFVLEYFGDYPVNLWIELWVMNSKEFWELCNEQKDDRLFSLNPIVCLENEKNWKKKIFFKKNFFLK
jgi:hypothetical protein